MQHPRTSTATPAHRPPTAPTTRRGGRLAGVAAALTAAVALTTLGGTTAHRPPTAPTTTRRGGRLAGVAAALTAAVALTTLGGTTAHGADNPYERGPAPTEASVEAPRGPYAVSETTVSPLAVTGFGGGTVYYPTSTADGTFGAIAVSPGYTGTQSSIAWLGPRLASQGFVVFTIDTLTTLDQPDSRGRQLLAALDYLTQKSSVRGRIDSTRLGVMGHSMGGGGSLEAAKSRPPCRRPSP